MKGSVAATSSNGSSAKILDCNAATATVLAAAIGKAQWEMWTILSGKFNENWKIATAAAAGAGVVQIGVCKIFIKDNASASTHGHKMWSEVNVATQLNGKSENVHACVCMCAVKI